MYIPYANEISQMNLSEQDFQQYWIIIIYLFYLFLFISLIAPVPIHFHCMEKSSMLILLTIYIY